MTLAQLPGYYCAAWLVDKIGRKYTLSAFLLFSGVAAISSAMPRRLRPS